MNIFIICATVVICIYIICYHINKSNRDKLVHDNELNDLYNDIDNIKFTVDKLKSIELYSDTVKCGLLTISNVIDKYYDKEGVEDSEES